MSSVLESASTTKKFEFLNVYKLTQSTTNLTDCVCQCSLLYLYTQVTPSAVHIHLSLGILHDVCSNLKLCNVYVCNAMHCNCKGFFQEIRQLKATLQRLFVGSCVKQTPTPTCAVVISPSSLLLLLLFLFTLNKQKPSKHNSVLIGAY
jgi:hypothetical protein